MKIRISLLASILVLGCALVQAQSSYDIETRYGKRVNVYSVSENLWMSPSYDSQGQVCLMRVFPKAVSESTNYHDPYLNMDETLRFINEVFPVYTRGRREPGTGMTELGGGVAWTRFKYEHVKFVFLSSFRLTKLPEKSDENFLLDFPADEGSAAEYQRQREMKTDDQLMRDHAQGNRILEIVWVGRKCVKP
jgi:hypothetical protein